MPTFTQKVLKVVSSIPRGQVLTYKQVAAAAGSPRAFRAVGTILSKNYNPKIPCHRVIKSNGGIGNYNRGASKKASLLKDEMAI
jgi:methylated-DNA-[protein]-cysteine S-methyltransferase